VSPPGYILSSGVSEYVVLIVGSDELIVNVPYAYTTIYFLMTLILLLELKKKSKLNTILHIKILFKRCAGEKLDAKERIVFRS